MMTRRGFFDMLAMLPFVKVSRRPAMEVRPLDVRPDSGVAIERQFSQLGTAACFYVPFLGPDGGGT